MWSRMRSILLCILLCMFALCYSHPLSDGVHLCENGEKPCGDLHDKCIPERNICDGEANCPNGFDEENCSDNIPTFEEYLETEYLFCMADEFRCSNGKCIPLDRVCNEVADCKNQDDEGPLCGNCEGYGCGFKCQNFPTGPQCGCDAGTFLSVDGKTCEHEESCVMGVHNCSHHCSQIHDQVTCTCALGYKLVEDYDCDVNPEHRNGALFLVVNDSSIHRFPLFDKSASNDVVVSSSVAIKKISSVAFNAANKYLYFVADEGYRHTKIYVNNGAQSKQLYFGFGLKHIAVDWITNNVYYAADGLGIGVCRADGRYCYHLITGRGSAKGEKSTQTYGDLIVHPKRGLLIWTDYDSIEHANGVIMVAGMDGKKMRTLVLHSAKRLSSAIAMDYVMDHLLYVLDKELIVLDMNTLIRHKIGVDVVDPYSMISFNEYLYYVNRKTMTLMQYKNGQQASSIAHESFEGQHFSITINNTLYYETFGDPCEQLNCTHMCVLRETKADKIALAKCVCPDKYLKDESGACVFDSARHFEGPVRTSAANMETMCAEETACFNDGTCSEKVLNADLTPFCNCPRGFGGLYCEIKSSDLVEEGSSWLLTLFVLFVLVVIAISVAVCVLRMYPNMRNTFESFSNINMSPRIDRMNSSRNGGSSLRAKDTSVVPILSRSPNSAVSPSSSTTGLLRCAEQPSQPIQITSSFSNMTHSFSQQRMEEQVLERDIQVNCPSATDHKKIIDFD